MKKLITSILFASVLAITGTAFAAGEAEHPEQLDWSFEGWNGTYDRASAQRGLQIYRDICSACHGLKYVAFRNLTELGYSEDEVKALAAEYTFTEIDDYGDEAERAGLPSDHFPEPYDNPQQAAAGNLGVVPPDLSLMAKARADGANYIYSLMIGYNEDDGTNRFFPGGTIAMGQPLYGDDVEYSDGTEATMEQEAEDIAHFLMWAAEPKLEQRKKMGAAVMGFLIVLTILGWLSNRKVWQGIKGKKSDD